MNRLKLYSHSLRGLADALDQMAQAKGIKVTSFQYSNLLIHVDYLNDQMDGTSIYVTGIEDASTHN